MVGVDRETSHRHVGTVPTFTGEVSGPTSTILTFSASNLAEFALFAGDGEHGSVPPGPQSDSQSNVMVQRYVWRNGSKIVTTVVS